MDFFRPYRVANRDDDMTAGPHALDQPLALTPVLPLAERERQEIVTLLADPALAAPPAPA